MRTPVRLAGSYTFKESIMKTVNKTEGRFTYYSWIIKGLSLVGILFVVTSIISHQLERIAEENEQQQDIVASAKDKLTQLDCLARNVYYEAANESFEGKVAVAQVTLNRVESNKFAKTVCGVVYERNIVYQRVICQFSWYCEKGKAELQPKKSVAWAESQEVAKQVLLENFRLPSLRSALFYHADYINPQWGLPKVATIGRHIFYSKKS